VKIKAAIFCACLLWMSGLSQADFVPPIPVLRAMAPNGDLVVRIKQDDPGTKPLLSLYRYEPNEDRYIKESGFELRDDLPHQLFVSDSGDVVFISFSEEGAIALYSKDGELRGAWDLDDFLSKSQLRACPKTEASVQWFDGGEFVTRKFSFRGPSSGRISFGGVIDAATGDLAVNGRGR